MGTNIMTILSRAIIKFASFPFHFLSRDLILNLIFIDIGTVRCQLSFTACWSLFVFLYISHVTLTTKQHCKYTTSVDIQKLFKKLSLSFKITYDKNFWIEENKQTRIWI